MKIFQAPVRVEWNSQPVLTTAQLAEYFECTPDCIYANFRNNRERFVEGVHFAKLEGVNLSEFKKHVDSVYDQVADSEPLELNSPQDRRDNLNRIQIVGKGARCLYVWTERGTARHAKILNTKVAWEVHEKLEDLYFRVKEAIIAAKSAPVAASSPDLSVIQAQIDELKSTVASLVDIMKNAPVAASAPDLAAMQAQINELKSTVSTLVAANPKETPMNAKETYVYAILLEDDSVKIGLTNRPRARIAEIKSATGLKVKDFYFTPAMTCEDARFIEWACLEKFSSQRIKGEFFSVDFETACRVIDSFVKRFALPSVISDFELAEKLLTIADNISDPVKKETILIEAVNLFVGQKFV